MPVEKEGIGTGEGPNLPGKIHENVTVIEIVVQDLNATGITGIVINPDVLDHLGHHIDVADHALPLPIEGQEVGLAPHIVGEHRHHEL